MKVLDLMVDFIKMSKVWSLCLWRMPHGKKLPCTIELHTYLDIFIKSMVGLKMSILQNWVTWASKITLKNLQLCSIKLREATPPVTSHITWSRSIKCFILLSFGGFSFKYKSRKIKMNTEIDHICTQSGTWSSGYSWLIASSKPQSYSLPTLWSCLCLLV